MQMEILMKEIGKKEWSKEKENLSLKMETHMKVNGKMTESMGEGSTKELVDKYMMESSKMEKEMVMVNVSLPMERTTMGNGKIISLKDLVSWLEKIKEKKWCIKDNSRRESEMAGEFILLTTETFMMETGKMESLLERA